MKILVGHIMLVFAVSMILPLSLHAGPSAPISKPVTNFDYVFKLVGPYDSWEKDFYKAYSLYRKKDRASLDKASKMFEDLFNRGFNEMSEFRRGRTLAQYALGNCMLALAMYEKDTEKREELVAYSQGVRQEAANTWANITGAKWSVQDNDHNARGFARESAAFQRFMNKLDSVIF